MAHEPADAPMTAQGPGLVCAHHHLYSSLARWLPGPARTPLGFLEVLELLWWRLDVALTPADIAWSARLGAVEALEAGCTAIVDHHESPAAIDGSLDVIAEACAEVGVRVVCAYGVTDRHGAGGAKAGLAENERFLRAGGRGLVGVHASFTCSDDTLEAAAGLATDLDVGVHVHVAEGEGDTWPRLARLADERWLLAHGVHLPDHHGLAGTIVHNPRSNMNNGVGYARPARFANPVALGTDGIGADLLEEARLAFARLREHDATAPPTVTWAWLEQGWALVPEAQADIVTWSDEPGVFATGVRAVDVVVAGEVVLSEGRTTRVDADEVRARAAEQAASLAGRW
ncbi:MAG: amidohydrolase family protein [Acidimicrobiia bacterium]|nr:amidohydrolase family protein [Acidimicrobiia bacterium]